MRVLLQRVSHASVVVEEKAVGEISQGYLLLVGIGHDDTEEVVRRLAKKIANLRLFPNDVGKFDHSLLDVEGAALVVSQFTLMGNTKKGSRPSFIAAAPPKTASPLCDYFSEALRLQGILQIETGRFGAHMDVTLCNDGPVTLWLDSDA